MIALPSLQEKANAVKTILVVEDDEDLGDLILQVIRQESNRNGQSTYKAVLATDSLQALNMINTVKPDLFLLDYYLPRMNGLDLYDRLHSTHGFEQTPAIFLSANPPRKEIEKRHLISIKKPFNLNELMHTINSLLA